MKENEKLINNKDMESKKYNVKESLKFHSTLVEIANRKLDLKSSINYCLAKNLKRTTSIYDNFLEDNQLRLNSYALKDEKGEFILNNNLYDFGNKKKEADEKYKELLNAISNYEPYTIKKSEETDAIPFELLSVLIDVIVIE